MALNVIDVIRTYIFYFEQDINFSKTFNYEKLKSNINLTFGESISQFITFS